MGMVETGGLLPNVTFLGVAGRRGTAGDIERLDREDIENIPSFKELEDVLKDFKTQRKMYFGVKAFSRKGAEVKAEREAKEVIRSWSERYGDGTVRTFSSENWSIGGSTSYHQDSMMIKPKDIFGVFDERPDLAPDEYIVEVGLSFSPW